MRPVWEYFSPPAATCPNPRVSQADPPVRAPGIPRPGGPWDPGLCASAGTSPVATSGSRGGIEPPTPATGGSRGPGGHGIPGCALRLGGAQPRPRVGGAGVFLQPRPREQLLRVALRPRAQLIRPATAGTLTNASAIA